jgi:hypothetical protein
LVFLVVSFPLDFPPIIYTRSCRLKHKYKFLTIPVLRVMSPSYQIGILTNVSYSLNIRYDT